MTTGMSAPPIGRTSRTPKRSAPSRSSTIQTPVLGRAGGDAEADERGEEEAVHDLLGREGDRSPGQELLQLPERDEAAREADRADERREEHRSDLVAREVAGRRRQAVELRRRDQRGRAAADAVEERDHLRHRGHLHAGGPRRPR